MNHFILEDSALYVNIWQDRRVVFSLLFLLMITINCGYYIKIIKPKLWVNYSRTLKLKKQYDGKFPRISFLSQLQQMVLRKPTALKCQRKQTKMSQ